MKKIEASNRARKGESFYLVVSAFGIPLHWAGMWLDVKRPTILVDTAKVLPFSSWRHEHSFQKVKNGTEMTDDLEYRIVWFLGGELTARTVFALFFTIVFAARHRSTVKLLKR
ncbi:MAG: hypothetical protein JO076_05215 [Verrucomicrobia bacterium]|nr:hypothetical protein [Verrucomicrobiota bacterium]